jgi:TetR/AcrR family transcriptional repressor of mexJK operon
MEQKTTAKGEKGSARPVKERRTPGPASRAKNSRIISAARKLFVRHGYDETSMEAIAREAGVGKATVYAHFSAKEQLFAAIVSIEGEEHFMKMKFARPVSLIEDLHEFGNSAFTLLIDPENTAILRMVVAEVNKFPDLGRIFFETGPTRFVECVAEYLERADATGELSIPDPKLAALQFLALITAEVRMASLLGVIGRLDEATARRAVHAGVETFLRAYRAGKGGAERLV